MNSAREQWRNRVKQSPQCPKDIWEDDSKLGSLWFPDSYGSLRLTPSGFVFFVTTLNLPHYTWGNQTGVWPLWFHKLTAKSLTAPYFYDRYTFTSFDELLATEIGIWGGDVLKWAEHRAQAEEIIRKLEKL